MTHDGAGCGDVYIDTSKIPDYARDDLARCALRLMRNILATPGGREALEREKAAYLAERKAARSRERS